MTHERPFLVVRVVVYQRLMMLTKAQSIAYVADTGPPAVSLDVILCMDDSAISPVPKLRLAAAFNRNCRCLIVEEPALARELQAALSVQNAVTPASYLPGSMMSATAVFLSPEDVQQLHAAIQAIERVIATPSYQEQVLSWADPIARFNRGGHGVCMGYDFHLDVSGPRLIEVNTNAGGLLLNGVLARAARACCSEAQSMSVGCKDPARLDRLILEMFRSEWQIQRGSAPLRSIAIVDDQPESQYLATEFRLFAELFKRHGWQAMIADAAALVLHGSTLTVGDDTIDLIYNRLTDFRLSEPSHAAVRAAFASGATVVTPNPRTYALYADKRNLTVLSDRAFLNSLELPSATIDTLAQCVPQTLLVTPELAPQLWTERRRWFFKPVMGFGSRGAYRGDKLTKRVFESIAQGGYIAQARVDPATRANPTRDAEPLKYDIRCYVYRSEIQLTAARLYQGQTTNFRTAGGGFSPVFYARTVA
ncbi:MAG: hypothetical protein ABI145_08570 [Steroidobacteraceae bacterium]